MSKEEGRGEGRGAGGPATNSHPAVCFPQVTENHYLASLICAFSIFLLGKWCSQSLTLQLEWLGQSVVSCLVAGRRLFLKHGASRAQRAGIFPVCVEGGLGQGRNGGEDSVIRACADEPASRVLDRRRALPTRD